MFLKSSVCGASRRKTGRRDCKSIIIGVFDPVGPFQADSKSKLLTF